MNRLCKLLAVSISAAALAACSEEAPREKAENPAQQDSTQDLTVSLVTIVPGGGQPVDVEPPQAKKFDGDPEQIAAGRQLYQAYNCVGCHFNGGGGMGPALMDDKWIYGSSMENIAATIIQGRPNGMPTFRNMVAGDQVWQLAAYVRSLSDLSKKEQSP